jgi:hypothetical protein
MSLSGKRDGCPANAKRALRTCKAMPVENVDCRAPTPLKRFCAEGALGTLVALTLVRELGPVLGALMIAARAGSAMAESWARCSLRNRLTRLR